MSEQNQPQDDEFLSAVGFLSPKRITALLDAESDRGVILILGAYLEEILALIIRAASTSDQLGKDLLAFRGPAGDFRSKITLSEAFGLISPDESKALNALRKIRNSAAHFDQKGRGFDVLFDSPQTVEQVRVFWSHLNLQFNFDKPEEARELFVAAGRLLASKLLLRLVQTRPAPVAMSVKEAANIWRERMGESPIGQALSEAEKEVGEGNPERLLNLFRSMAGQLKEQAQNRLPDKET